MYSTTLAQLGNEQSIKGLLTTMATAGVLQSLDKAMGFDSTPTATGQTGSAATGVNGVATSQAAKAFQQNLLKNVTNNVAGSAIDAAINGKAFDEKALSSALSSALVTAGMAAGANAIGDASTGNNGNPAQIDAFTQKLAHAVLGCAGGAATVGNGSGCSAGAVGAVVGELAANYALDNGSSKADASAFAKTLSAVAGVMAGGGGNNAAAVNIAATTGANAAENNRQLHPTETQKAAQLAALSSGKYTAAQIANAMRNSGYGTKENVTTGMLIDVNKSQDRYDPGAQFNAPVNGMSAQVLPSNGNVDPGLAAFIIANTGGANSPYAWMGVQLGKVTPPAATSSSNTFSSGYNYMGNSSAGMASGVSTENRTQAQIDASLNQTTMGIVTAPVWVPLVGAAAMYSPLGFGLGAGGDAAGQAYQSYSTTGQVTIRPTQSVFSGVTGAVALPLAAMLPAVGASASGIGGLAGNAAAGGVTGATNTFFNNVYYDEATKLDAAFGLGALFGGLGAVSGSLLNKGFSNLLSNTPNIPLSGPVAPLAAQGTLNPLPAQIGNAVSNTIGVFSAFIPLDNGKGTQDKTKQEQSK